MYYLCDSLYVFLFVHALPFFTLGSRCAIIPAYPNLLGCRVVCLCQRSSLAEAFFILPAHPVRRLHDFPVTFHKLRAMQPQPLFFGFYHVCKFFLCHPITLRSIPLQVPAPATDRRTAPCISSHLPYFPISGQYRKGSCSRE